MINRLAPAPKRWRQPISTVLRWLSIIAVVVFQFAWVQPAGAAQLTPRKLTLTSSAPSAQTTYTFNVTTATTATIQSIDVQICLAPSGTCNIPTGFTVTGDAFGSTTFSGAWTNSAATPGHLRLTATGASSTTTGTAKNFSWTSVTNGSNANESFYGRITTYSDTAYTTPVDTGNVGASTAQQITVNATVDESLIFCVGTASTTQGVNCTNMTGTTVALGTLSASSTNTGTSLFTVSTNAASGYAVTVTGNTLTSGGNTVTAMGGTTSTIGTSQFGINLVANTTPSVGAARQGPGSGAATASYNTANSFKFLSTDTIASTASAANSDFNTFTVSYMANIAGNQASGSYTTTLTYVCTGSF